MEKPELTITRKDLAKIKEAAFGHIHDTFPKNIDETELQILLICKGFLHHLGHHNINLPVKVEYEWEKHNVKKY